MSCFYTSLGRGMEIRSKGGRLPSYEDILEEIATFLEREDEDLYGRSLPHPPPPPLPPLIPPSSLPPVLKSKSPRYSSLGLRERRPLCHRCRGELSGKCLIEACSVDETKCRDCGKELSAKCILDICDKIRWAPLH